MKFRQFLNEAESIESYEHSQESPVLHNFLWHLTSPTVVHSEFDGSQSHIKRLDEAETVDTAHPDPHHSSNIKAAGLQHEPQGNIFHHLRDGFSKAFPDNESPQETKKKAMEARKHFRKFMNERGGLSIKNTTNLLNQNGKTKLSTGAGVNTVGLSLAPHTSSGYKFNACPKASTECAKNCLGFTAGGNRQYPEAAFKAKLLRHQYLHEHPEHAARLISHEIGENEKWADKNGYKSGVRLNVTQDLPWEHLMPKKFFERHGNSQFYDYTKVHGRLKNQDMPKNYTLALSHTGGNHEESNDKHVIDALDRGHVVAMVHQKSKITPTHIEDVKTGKRYPIVNGDEDDNVYDRHANAGIPKTQGVVSGLKLKGVKNEAAGYFANKVDDDGIIRINKGVPAEHQNHQPMVTPAKRIDVKNV
jgi:hypothetical protein